MSYVLCNDYYHIDLVTLVISTGFTDFLTSGLQQNQTVEYEAEIFSFNSRGRSEVVRLLKITLNAEEIVAALSLTQCWEITILTNYTFIIQT